jgi:hypothetical protein
MKKTLILGISVVILFSSTLHAQEKFYTKAGKISFFSATSMENISAVNKTVVCLLNIKTGDLQFAVLMKGFEFKKALMQEDFNRDYIESSKFPKSEFKGQISNNSTINYAVNGKYNAEVKGKLSLHGVTKDISANGTITVKDGKVSLNSVFTILIADYSITVPRIYMDNISKSIKITVDCNLEALK